MQEFIKKLKLRNYKFLSSYSYMLIPIENEFSKIKNDVKWLYEQTFIIFTEVSNVNNNDCVGYSMHITQNITNCAARILNEHQ